MPNYITALILLLIPATFILMVARDPLSSHFSKKEFRSYRNTWLVITICLFLSPGIWIFYAIAAVVMLRQRYATDADRIATYCFLLFIVPSIEVRVPGLFGIKTLFLLDYQRLLALIILMPLFSKSLNKGLSVHPSDKYLALYFAYVSIMAFRGENTTEILRDIVIHFVDVIIPYFVISRNIKSIEHLNRAFLAAMFSLALLAGEAVMEAVRHWELYNHTGHRLIGERIFRFSSERAGLLRARSIFSSPIVLGYAMMLLLALLMYLKPYFTKPVRFYSLVGVAVAALLVTFSRGPWVATALALATYIYMNAGATKAMGYLVMGGTVGAVVLVSTEMGRSILNLLPFFGGTEAAGTFDYRAQLFEKGLILVKRNPLFGDHFFLRTPEMEAMRQGQGIIDTVNIYLSIAMRLGLVGLFLFVMIFIPTLFFIYRRARKLPPSEERLAQSGRMLVSFMVGGLFLIATVSNIDYVPVLYFLGAAFMASWVGLYREYESRSDAKSIVVRERANTRYANMNRRGTAGL